MSKILVTGGSGLIGRALTRTLQREGHSVCWLSRSSGTTEGVRRYTWDIARGSVDPEALKDADHIIHLSGAGIADKPWTAPRIRELHASRGGAARLLLKTVETKGFRPKSFSSASGIGFYGTITTDHVFSEGDPAGTDTIALLTNDWEEAADEWASTCRVVKLRTPMVLAREGGALKRLSPPFRIGLGAALGSGKQWMPWIHIDDLVAGYIRSITDEGMHGAYNVVADEQPMNKDFMRVVAEALGRPFFLPNVPAFALRMVLGEMSIILLEGSRASNERLLSAGATLRFGSLRSALLDTLGQ